MYSHYAPACGKPYVVAPHFIFALTISHVEIMVMKASNSSRLMGSHSMATTQTLNRKTAGNATQPKDRLSGLKENWKSDLMSGFIIFLIALPLCLGVAMASGVPPMAGIISAVIGGLIVSQISGSYVTINGPAAGLIVVILGTVDRFGGGGQGYHVALAATVVAGLALFVLGLFKAGELGHFFPSSVVHGMLAAIGIIIMSKQFHIMLGVSPHAREPLELIAEIPHSLVSLNPQVSLIGLSSLVLLIVHASTGNKIIKRVPAPLIVVLVAIGLGAALGLDHKHVYSFAQQNYLLDPAKVLVSLPSNVMDGVAHPDFSKIGMYSFWLAVFSITFVQGVETLLSAAAVDRLDRFGRQSNLSSDVAAVGLGSAISGLIGGLPLIAEIVRSSANVDNGARTRWSNFFHGMFMLVCVLLAASLLNRIPLCALAALLVFTGYRLASPRVFKETFEIGIEQAIIFTTTIIATLATDLLIGVTVGIVTKLAVHIMNGAPPLGLFSPDITVTAGTDGTYFVDIRRAAIFSNYLPMKKQLDILPSGARVQVDLSGALLVDHTVMDKLHHYAEAYRAKGGVFEICGLERHSSVSHHPLSARRLRPLPG